MEPYINSARWDTELRNAGFAGVHTLSYDGYLNNNIVAVPAYHDVRPKQQVTVLHLDERPGPLIQELVAQLERAGFGVDHRQLEDSQKPLPPNQDVISTLDLCGPFFHDMTEDNLVNFQRFVKTARQGQCNTLWITGASQVGCVSDPRYAPAIGVARTIRTETGLDFATVELEDFKNCLSIVPKILVEFRQRQSIDEQTNPEGEWAVVGDKVLIARYHFIKVSEELKSRGENRSNMVKKVEQQRAGLANSLFWKQVSQPPLGADEVRIQVKAVGLNFKVSASLARHISHSYSRAACLLQTLQLTPYRTSSSQSA